MRRALLALIVAGGLAVRLASSVFARGPGTAAGASDGAACAGLNHAPSNAGTEIARDQTGCP